jgi:hypothetical protein
VLGLLGGDARTFDEETREPDREQDEEDQRVFGLGLDADAVRTLDVAAHRGPTDTDEERDAGDLRTERVRDIRVAMQ